MNEKLVGMTNLLFNAKSHNNLLRWENRALITSFGHLLTSFIVPSFLLLAWSRSLFSSFQSYQSHRHFTSDRCYVLPMFVIMNSIYHIRPSFIELFSQSFRLPYRYLLCCCSWLALHGANEVVFVVDRYLRASACPLSGLCKPRHAYSWQCTVLPTLDQFTWS